MVSEELSVEELDKREVRKTNNDHLANKPLYDDYIYDDKMMRGHTGMKQQIAKENSSSISGNGGNHKPKKATGNPSTTTQKISKKPQTPSQKSINNPITLNLGLQNLSAVE